LGKPDHGKEEKRQKARPDPKTPFTSPYYSHILLGISTVATQRHYQLMLVINEKTSYSAFYHRL
jgi:hypothetical protein